MRANGDYFDQPGQLAGLTEQELITELADIDIALRGFDAQQRRDSLRGTMSRLTVLVLRQRAICQELRRRGEPSGVHPASESRDQPLATVHRLPLPRRTEDSPDRLEG